MKKPNTVGGGKNTTKNGLKFERQTELLDLFKRYPNFSVNVLKPSKKGAKTKFAEIYQKGELVGYFAEKNSLYREFLAQKGSDISEKTYSKLLPDSVFVNEVNKTAYVIEKKFQGGAGSVDEKLQTCDYKRNFYYKPIFDKLGYKIEFYFVLSDYFDDKRKSHVFEYIVSVGCKYFFTFLPLSELGLSD